MTFVQGVQWLVKGAEGLYDQSIKLMLQTAGEDKGIIVDSRLYSNLCFRDREEYLIGKGGDEELSMIPGSIRSKEEEASNNKVFKETLFDDTLGYCRLSRPSSSGKPQDISIPCYPIAAVDPVHNHLQNSNSCIWMAPGRVESCARVMECGVSNVLLQYFQRGCI